MKLKFQGRFKYTFICSQINFLALLNSTSQAQTQTAVKSHDFNSLSIFVFYQREWWGENLYHVLKLLVQTRVWKHGSENFGYQANCATNSTFLNNTVLEPVEFSMLWWQDSTLGSLEIVILLTLDTVYRWTLFFWQVYQKSAWNVPKHWYLGLWQGLNIVLWSVWSVFVLHPQHQQGAALKS